MLNFSHQTRVFLCTQPVDLRKSFRGLCPRRLAQDRRGMRGQPRKWDCTIAMIFYHCVVLSSPLDLAVSWTNFPATN